MAWFSRNSEVAPADPVRDLTQERIVEIFDEEEWHYIIDDDGDLGGRWGDVIIYFIILGQQKEMLQIVGRMSTPIDEAHHDEAMIFIEDWHRDRFWPKAYTVFDDEGAMRVCAEVNIDHEPGVSKLQLRQHIRCAVGTQMQFYEALRERFGMPPMDEE